MPSLDNSVKKLLEKSGGLFRLDMIYLIKGSFWTTLSFIAGTLASIVTMIAFGNLLPREAYGIYNYLLSLGASLTFLTFTGLGQAVMRSVARGYESVVPAALKIYLKCNLAAVACILIAALYYGIKGNMLFSVSLLMLAAAYPIAEAYHLYKQVLTGRRQFELLTKISSITSLVGALATLTTLYFTDRVLILIAVYTATSLIPNIIAYNFVEKKLTKGLPEEGEMNELKRTAFHFTAAGVVGVIASHIDKIVLFQAAGPVALAVYGFASAGPDKLSSLIKNWLSIALPKLTRRSLEQIEEILYLRIAFLLLTGTMLALIYFFIAPVFFKLFLPKYLDAVIYSQVLTWSLVATPVTVYLGSIFSSQNMLRATYALSLGNHFLRITLFVILGWYWQIWGLVFASIIYSLLHAIYGIIIWEIESKRLIKKNG